MSKVRFGKSFTDVLFKFRTLLDQIREDVHELGSGQAFEKDRGRQMASIFARNFFQLAFLAIGTSFDEFRVWRWCVSYQ